MPTESRGGIVAGNDYPITIVDMDGGVQPPQVYKLRKNAVGRILPAVDFNYAITLKVKGAQVGTTVPTTPVDIVPLFWALTENGLPDFAQHLLVFGLNGTLAYQGQGSDPITGEPTSWQLERTFSHTCGINTVPSVTEDTEITYYIQVTTTNTWTITVMETIPGRTPSETVEVPFITFNDFALPAPQLVPMTFYVGWPVVISGGTQFSLGTPIFTPPGVPGHDRGLIYTEVTVVEEQ